MPQELLVTPTDVAINMREICCNHITILVIVHTSSEDGGGDGDGLDVGDGGGAAEQADVGGEGRLQARLTLASLQALNQRGLLAADVRACIIIICILYASVVCMSM